MTNWTIDRGDEGARGPKPAPAFTGMTLLMSTEELLAVLEDGAAATAAPPTRRTAESRLVLVPPPEDDVEAASSPPAAGAPATDVRPAWKPAHAPSPRPSLRRRLQCARRGHDPRPHRPLPHDEVVYRCLRCGRPASPPQG